MFRLVTLIFLILFSTLSIPPVQAQEKGRTILVFDASGSMWGQIDGKAKITIAQEVIGNLLSTIPDDEALGLTVYGHRRKGDCGDIESLVAPGTGNRAAIAAAVNKILPKGKTPLSAAVIAAAEELKYAEEKATVILISDGKETCEFDPCEVGRRLEAAGVDFTAHVVGFDVADPLARAQLQCLAENTGGVFRTASNAQELTEALNTVAKPAPPPPPTEGHVRFVATEGPNGASLTDGLIWTATNLDTNTVVLGPEARPNLDLKLLPGQYRIDVLRSDNETNAEAVLKVFPNTNTTVTLVLPLIIPEATLSAPDTVIAGGSLTVDWDGPDGQGDYISAAAPSAGDNEYATYTYTRNGSPLALRAPPEPGDYEIRYILNERGKALARQKITVLPVEASLQAADTANAGDTVTVDWTGPNYERDYISVAAIGARGQDYVNYAYTRNGNSVGLLMPTKPGDYEIRYIMSLGSTIIASRKITVTDISATLQSVDTAPVGAPVAVDWTGPNYQSDYLSVARPEARGADYVGYVYTKKGSPGTLKMPPWPGTYEVRYILNQGGKILARKSIEVTPLNVTINAPTGVQAGQVIQVTHDGPNYERDYIALASPGSKDTDYLAYGYTIDGSSRNIQVPPKAGTYLLRYIINAAPDTKIGEVTLDVAPVSATVTAPDEAAPGSYIDVSWTGPAYNRDYIAIGHKNSTQYLVYANTRTGATVQIKVPDTPGEYEVWYVMDVGSTILVRRPLIVK